MSKRKILMSVILAVVIMASSLCVFAQGEATPVATFNSETRNITVSNVKGASGTIIVFSPSYDMYTYDNIEYFGTAKADGDGNIIFTVPALEENVPFGKYVCKFAITDENGVTQYRLNCYYPWVKSGVSTLQKFWYDTDESGNVTATATFSSAPAESYKMILAFYEGNLLKKVVSDDNVEDLKLTATAAKGNYTNIKAFLLDKTTLEPVIININADLN